MALPVISELKARVRESVVASAPELFALSENLHAHPETAWQEYRASAWVAEALERRGFTVERPYLGFDTALRGHLGAGDTRVALIAEYDALPGLGHACGHNIISAVAVGAAIALAPYVGELGLTLEVLGTPAEEGGGGKIELIDRGAFDGLALALMVHPAPVDVAEARPFAVEHFHVEYRGKAAHAAAYPEQGVNAADGMTIAQVAIGLLRQQLPPTVRVHGIVTSGGEAPNAIPERVTGRWYVRAESLRELAEIMPRVESCFEAGARATGSQLTLSPESQPYSEFCADEETLDLYRQNAVALGRVFSDDPGVASMNRASTDMGNVSQLVPSIHPYIGIDSLPARNHEREFADHCVGPDAERAILDGATALAWTVIDRFS